MTAQTDKIAALEAAVSIMQAERDAKWLAFREADSEFRAASRDLLLARMTPDEDDNPEASHG